VLTAGTVQEITDTYLDTADGQLAEARLAFRIRTVVEGGESQTFLTLKGKSVAKGTWQVERLEVELPWSATAARTMGRELEKLSIVINRTWDQDGIPETAEAFARALGLQVVQRRTTRRHARDVLAGSGQMRQRVAELSIDHVKFESAGSPIDLYEVEIEAKGDPTGAVVDGVTSSLLQDFGAELRPWRHSKLATGKAIEEMLRSSTPALRTGGPVGPAGIEEIARFLEENGETV
jgi:inorganic triphosphatase YgiF